ncbi:chemotaxis protein CheW [Trichloromonas sp.]|uniref:chemotaxis protein CheW n=1 Tax=Trichloromonas sp. TaxID=3069249 RepID=UPI003D81A61C
MDLADIRKKAKTQKKNDADVGRVAQKSAPSIQGVPVAEHPPMPQAAGPTVMPAAQIQSCTDAIQELFDCPFQIDLVEEGNRHDITRKQLEEKSNSRQWLTFSLCSEEYAIDIESVNEIIKPREVTDIPRVPGFMLGIISLRGIIVPVYDLSCRLGLGEVEISQLSRVIVCQHEDKMIGLLVDSITQVVKINEKKIEPPPAVLSGLKREFVSGIGRYQGRMLIRLNLKNVLNPELA